MAESGERMPELALEWHRAGKGAVLATVVETWGSAPRRAGSQLVVSSEGEMEGSVSGGCVEGAVVVEAMEALEAGDAQLLEFGVSDDEAFAVGLACGGTIKVLVEPVGRVLPVEMLEALVDARAARQPVAYIVDVKAGTRQLVAAGDPEVVDRVRADRSGLDGYRYIGIHNPPLRMVVVGAVHIAQAILPMARMAGYDPVLVDPRPAFAAEARFPGERILETWPDEALSELGLDARTAVVTLTHDPKLDDPAIQAALASDAFYLGCLGSTRTHGKRVARLTEAGIAEDVLARIHAPVGLDIGAQNPAEIAVAIMAEITQRLRQG
ncbi:XdhC/CoxI family protein [Roseobacter sp. HKCCD9010]|nr:MULTISPECIES: XdhC/CoxI family protein [unclassified Roseobacter]MBF9050021.1 XdhC/CoxI family protein [Rhodobacterales bacterium HKCCD4356]NNY45501.1 XdhC/CoxI family protein [Roseobacter sp. HKCCD8801]NOD72855.1 XdhC/CoxI family protein [Roseobacter sp. HKCCD7581]NNV12264.1 XdhC/CoxI family protein [Roseobacter sp. HKCCD7357]NNV16273.1 XdhC/CoxI family protein [Roseobacter sp. HKCCD8768]